MQYICRTNSKANHNKDYSVVKTFKAARKGRLFLLFASTCKRGLAGVCMSFHPAHDDIDGEISRAGEEHEHEYGKVADGGFHLG